jgi:hypothetical protein
MVRLVRESTVRGVKPLSCLDCFAVAWHPSSDLLMPLRSGKHCDTASQSHHAKGFSSGKEHVSLYVSAYGIKSGMTAGMTEYSASQY